MELSQFDLNLLVTLDALLAEKNVTRAAMRIHLSQSATSGALARLRNFFQDQLLVHVGGKMVLTPLARDLIKPVRNLLLQTKATIATRARFDPISSRRRFSIAGTDYASTVFLADALRTVQRLGPDISFQFLPIGEQAMEAFDAGDLDFLILREIYAWKDHPRVPLFEDTYTVIAWTGNSHVGAKISLEDYLNLGHVAIHIGPVPHVDERFLNNLKYKRRVDVSTYSFEAIPHLVIGTNRIATLETRLARKYARLLPLKLIPLPIDIPPITMVLQWHKYHDQDPPYVWLRGVLAKQAVRLSGPPIASSRRPALRPVKNAHV